MKNELIKKFNLTGNCELNEELVIKRWKNHWFISRWHEKFRFIIPDKRSKEICLIKVNIHKNQASNMSNEVLKNLDEFKNADQATRDFYMYEKLSGLDDRYARKWVEKIMVYAGGIIGSSLIIAIMALILNK